MQEAAKRIAGGAKSAWWWLRQVMGDAAYENYLRSAARRSGVQGAAKSCCEELRKEGHLLTREEFYLDALHRRYSSVSRCC